MTTREVLFIEITPVPEFETVTCFEDSWTCHIAAAHVDMVDKLPDVRGVISDPTHVFVFGDRAPSNVVFFDEAIVNDQNEPLFVIVNRVKLDVRSAYYKTAWRNFRPSMMKMHTVIWSKT